MAGVGASDGDEPSGRLGRGLAALALLIIAIGLPINHLFGYALIVVATVLVFAGVVSAEPRRWLAATAVVGLAMLGQFILAAPRIEEGHNVFLVDKPGGTLEAGLPAEAFRFMAAEFDAQYPRERRCAPSAAGCWRGGGFPDRAFAFSADGIYQRPAYSRQVTDIDFADAVWLRLGFVNEVRYNWYDGTSDLGRATRERGPQAIFHPWRVTMPFFVMYRFPEAFAGSALCWRGSVLWEGPGEHFAALAHPSVACRTIEPGDAGRRIFGVAIRQDRPLAMNLDPTLTIRLRQLIAPALALIATVVVLRLLVRWRARRTALPFAVIAVALALTMLTDASLIGGFRPFNGGDDGLFYEGTGRLIAQHLLSGDITRALEGEEKVFYYGGPGLRYFRAIERFIFGDTFLGYLSLILLLPFAAYGVFRRFVPLRWALVLALFFLAIPVGALFGSTFILYVKWAARGFADPAAAILFLAGFAILGGRSQAGPGARFAPAFGAALWFALALFVRPNLAPAIGILLGGAGLAALWQRQAVRVAGLCIGFLPAFGMALHNWVFGGVFVLFSANAIVPGYFTGPSVYLAALGELARLDFSGEHVRRAGLQIAGWLSGPSESFLMAPLDALAVVVLVRVAIWGRNYDPWLRLAACATFAQHGVALFYPPYGRYYYLTWFLTMVVVVVWLREEGLHWLRRRYPDWMERAKLYPLVRAAGRGLDWCVSAAAPGTTESRLASARRQ